MIAVAVELAFTSPRVFEISQLQSAQDRVVLARTNAIIVRGEHYELVAMRDPGPQNRLAGSAQWCCANFYGNLDCMTVLKAEWEKVKAEMRGEPFKTGEHPARST
jgi:hypothetical protein